VTSRGTAASRAGRDPRTQDSTSPVQQQEVSSAEQHEVSLAGFAPSETGADLRIGRTGQLRLFDVDEGVGR
jgi:hypothetical protein